MTDKTNGNRLNGNTPVWIALITLVGMTLGLHYFQLDRVSRARDCAEDAKEAAVRVEEREAAHYQELKRIMLRIEDKLDGL